LSRQSGRPVPNRGKGVRCDEIGRWADRPFSRCRTYHQLKQLLCGDRRRGLRPVTCCPATMRCARPTTYPHRGPPGAHELEFEGVIERVKGRARSSPTKDGAGPGAVADGLFEDRRPRWALHSEVRSCGWCRRTATCRGAAHPTDTPVVLLERLRFVEELPGCSP